MKYHAERISPEAARNTHTMLNAVPQRAEFNSGIWQDLECRMAGRITGMRLQDLPEYPAIALREVLVNAVVHTDYTLRGMQHMVAIFPTGWRSRTRACCRSV